MLRRSGSSDKAFLNQALEVIERNGRTQAQLINDLLDISRITTGKLDIDTRPVELSAVIRAAIDVVRPEADSKQIQLQPMLAPGANQVLGDLNRLQQVMWNLLSNAVKFTPHGGRVEICLVRADSHLEVTVSDNGKGIREDFLPCVFERFSQADAARGHAGLGLGLAIARQIVELHGGKIEAESPGEGLGSTFRVRLPLLTGTRGGGQSGRNKLRGCFKSE
jgi:signal transduction histidine kinase